VTDNTTPPVPPIPPVPESGAPAPVEPQAPAAPAAPTGGEYVVPGTAPTADPYAQPTQPAAYPSAPPAYGAAPDANPYAQQAPAYGQQPGYAEQGAPYAYNAGYAVAPPKGMSIAALICGIGSIVTLSFGLGFFAGVAAVILGFIAKRSQPYAKGFWLTGIITGFVAIGISVIAVIGFILFYALALGSGYSSYDSF